ncbi:MAG TPA: photosynthetic reaction center cytochrome c subunit family protein [Blastocatellia bacterium]|nr:photosynthetic reaction center cytochrome c subunit family protein [Blastocatellia bacterium]
MNKEYIVYGIGGIVLGLVLGFYSANWFGPKPVPGAMAASTGEKSTSVNSPGPGVPGQQLPPNHPPVDTGQTIPAPPLPASASSAPSASSDEAQLPSLDPLPGSSREERAEQKYKNIQLLKGLPSDRLMNVMFAFKASLGVDCTYCHIKDQFEKDDKPPKQVARKMITLVRDTNGKLGGAARVTCFTCHRGQIRPAS